MAAPKTGSRALIQAGTCCSICQLPSWPTVILKSCKSVLTRQASSSNILISLFALFSNLIVTRISFSSFFACSKKGRQKQMLSSALAASLSSAYATWWAYLISVSFSLNVSIRHLLRQRAKILTPAVFVHSTTTEPLVEKGMTTKSLTRALAWTGSGALRRPWTFCYFFFQEKK